MPSRCIIEFCYFKGCLELFKHFFFQEMSHSFQLRIVDIHAHRNLTCMKIQKKKKKKKFLILLCFPKCSPSLPDVISIPFQFLPDFFSIRERLSMPSFGYAAVWLVVFNTLIIARKVNVKKYVQCSNLLAPPVLILPKVS